MTGVVAVSLNKPGDSYRYVMKRHPDDFGVFLKHVLNTAPMEVVTSTVAETLESLSGESDPDIKVFRALKAVVRSRKSLFPLIADTRRKLMQLTVTTREVSGEVRSAMSELGEPAAPVGVYAEIGTVGRFMSSVPAVRTYVINDSFGGAVGAVERGSRAHERLKVDFGKAWSSFRTARAAIGKAGADVVSVYAGLHHLTAKNLGHMLKNLGHLVKPGGLLLLREHDVSTKRVHMMAEVAHITFNALMDESEALERSEIRHFRTIPEWNRILKRHGFRNTGVSRVDPNDPTADVLLIYRRH